MFFPWKAATTGGKESREGTKGNFFNGNFQVHFDILLYLNKNNMMKIVKHVA